MPYKISGLLNRTARVIAINEANWTIESNTTKSGGSYSVTGLSEGPKLIIALSEDDSPIAYQTIIPVVHDTHADGGTVSYYGGYRIHVFTVSSQLNVLGGGNFEYLIVGGGGAGGTNQGGGGGGGGMLTGTALYVGSGLYNVTVGAGGLEYNSGGVSSIFSISASGGGKGGSGTDDGTAGGCGGGAGIARSMPGNSWYYPLGGAGISGQGYRGGNSYQGQQIIQAPGGGGGTGAQGNDANASTVQHGGIGRISNITGTSVYYGGGGGGGRAAVNDSHGPGNGGQGGGGRGCDGSTYTDAIPGTNGLGGGGGGGSYAYDHGDRTHGARGGSGIVVVRYLYEGVPY